VLTCDERTPVVLDHALIVPRGELASVN
jgi:hypothetical protein